MKCLIRKDLLFWEVPSQSALELELEIVEEDDGSPEWEDVSEDESWDTFVIDDDGLEPSVDKNEL